MAKNRKYVVRNHKSRSNRGHYVVKKHSVKNIWAALGGILGGGGGAAAGGAGGMMGGMGGLGGMLGGMMGGGGGKGKGGGGKGVTVINNNTNTANAGDNSTFSNLSMPDFSGINTNPEKKKATGVTPLSGLFGQGGGGGGGLFGGGGAAPAGGSTP